MKGFISIVSTIIFVVGVAIGSLGAVMIGWGILFGPKGDPQSPEGSFPAYAFGFIAMFIGLVTPRAEPAAPRSRGRLVTSGRRLPLNGQVVGRTDELSHYPRRTADRPPGLAVRRPSNTVLQSDEHLGRYAPSVDRR